MQRIYVADSVPMAWHMANVLEHQGIQALVKNDRLYSVAGAVPINECMPEVWIRNDLDYIRAGRIIKEFESSAIIEEPDWWCRACAEVNAGNFDLCWNCQTERLASSDAD
ncbi:MAG TPA: hypothetical protein DCS89_07135 [Gammaproteobacteria bacterium]|nr:hypothetical protein [Gammaproteobacteria bacterium]HAT26768.1 hypothetical protein [Gammaproteobacteria bacterium]